MRVFDGLIGNEDIKNTRLAITEATKTVLGNAFELICLAKTEKI